MKNEWASCASSWSEARCTAGASSSTSWQAPNRQRSRSAAAWWLGSRRRSPLQEQRGEGGQGRRLHFLAEGRRGATPASRSSRQGCKQQLSSGQWPANRSPVGHQHAAGRQCPPLLGSRERSMQLGGAAVQLHATQQAQQAAHLSEEWLERDGWMRWDSVNGMGSPMPTKPKARPASPHPCSATQPPHLLQALEVLRATVLVGILVQQLLQQSHLTPQVGAG